LALQKNIGIWSATSIVIGSIIGSNIFMKPSTMAGQIGSPSLLILVWIVAGLVSLFGAMVFGELGSTFPQTGGAYVYLEKMYGEFIAFLYGWSTIAVINTAAIAAIAYVFASYMGFFIPMPHFDPVTELSFKIHVPYIADIYPLQNAGVKLVAIFIILALAIVNYCSVKYGNAIQLVATIVKTMAILLLVFGILLSGAGNRANFITDSKNMVHNPWSVFLAFMSATTGAFAAYDGWVNVNMIADEIRNPQKNIPKSLFVGLLCCIMIYCLVNLAYLYTLPIDAMAASPMVAADASAKVLGKSGAGIIALMIVISALGATNINLLANARVVFAMGKDGTFFRWSGKVHPRFQTPGNAVVIMAVLSILFVISGTFDVLADMFVFMSWVFYLLNVIGFFILRIKMPALERPYRVNGYPWVPLVFVLFTLFYLGSTLYNDIANFRAGRTPMIESVIGLLLTLAGIPFYIYFKRKNLTSNGA
jgi:APA family basic amino acid/polyamine antiporter